MESDDKKFDLDIAQLLDKSLVILQKEINNLYTAAFSGKLNPAQARDLQGYIKLLHELEERQKVAALEAAKLAAAKAAQEPDPFVR